MDKRIKQAAGGLALALGLGGCGTTQMLPKATNPAQVSAWIEQSLDRFRALQIVEVGELVINLPSEATACYGVPCPGSAWVGPYREERARQAERLSRLADMAETAASDKYLSPRPMTEADAAIQSLSSLQVIRVAGLVEAKPQNNPDCYNLPCPSDVQAAAEVNGLRVAKVLAITETAKRSGL